MRHTLSTLLLCFGLSTPAFALSLEEAARLTSQHLFENLDTREISAGAVIASPSRRDPDYFYHWVRDAALVSGALVQELAQTSDSAARHVLIERLKQWVRFERGLQQTPNKSGGPGEPKFQVNGLAFDGDWGRPQNDGPAARAIAMIGFARELLREGQGDWVKRYLYEAVLPANTAIKTDLEYTAHHWGEDCFDLWEEVKGHHFFTRMLQRRALLDGAELAALLGDAGAAAFYRQQGVAVETELRKHVNVEKDLIEPTLDRTAGWNHKVEGLDAAVLLGILHGYRGDGFFAPSDPRVLRYAGKLERRFADLYAINQKMPRLSPLVGRYPEDVYSGVDMTGGNPWFITTHTVGEIYCRAGRELRSPQLREKGKLFLQRTVSHLGPSGRMTEQLQRETAAPQGAADLTWSYASYLTAFNVCAGDR